MQRAAKRSRSFEEILAEKGAENLGSPGGSQDHWDALSDVKSDMAEAQKSITRLQKQMAEIWEALANEQARRIEAVDDLRKVLDSIQRGERDMSGVPESQGSESPSSVLGQVIDLTVDDDEGEELEDGQVPEYPEPWEEAYPAPDREVVPESQALGRSD